MFAKLTLMCAFLMIGRRAREMERMMPVVNPPPGMMMNNNNTMMYEDESISQNGSIDTPSVGGGAGGGGLLSDCMEVDPPLDLTIPLDADDAVQIEDIVTSYKSSLDVFSESIPPPEAKNSINDLVNVCEVSIRRVIDMAKKIKTFKSLPQHTQICLLKGGSIELLIIRSVLSFDKERQQFLDASDNPNTGAMSVEQFRAAAMRPDTGSADGDPSTPPGIDPLLQFSLVEDFMKFIKVLAIDLKADETMLILLLLISLFSPDRPNLDLKDVVSREQERFSLLLQRYIESIMPVHEARIYYAKLLMKLTDIRNLNEESSQVFLNMSNETIQPLMKEVLDLKKPAASTAAGSSNASSPAALSDSSNTGSSNSSQQAQPMQTAS